MTVLYGSRNPPECPKCNSRAHEIGMTRITCLAHIPFTDDHGDLHDHDPNVGSQIRKCLNCRHHWKQIVYHDCPSCQWGRERGR